jgi:hypothetical protein
MVWNGQAVAVAEYNGPNVYYSAEFNYELRSLLNEGDHLPMHCGSSAVCSVLEKEYLNIDIVIVFSLTRATLIFPDMSTSTETLFSNHIPEARTANTASINHVKLQQIKSRPPYCDCVMNSY